MTIDEQINAALEQAKLYANDPLLIEASFDTTRNVLFMRLSDGRRLFVPKEELPELRNASSAQAQDIVIVAPKTGLWWPQLDDGIYLPDFLESRWHKISPANGTIAA